MLKATSSLGNLPHNTFYKIFDSKIYPIILYGSEIWGYQMYDILERVQIYACKRYLTVGLEAVNSVSLAECGRLPVYIFTFKRLVKYWLKIVDMNTDRYVRKCYDMLHNLDNQGKTNWATKVKNILCSTGIGEVWFNQGVGDKDIFMEAFVLRLKDIFLQTWYSDMSRKPKLSTYNNFKHIYEKEVYLDQIKISKYRHAMSIFQVWYT